MVYTGVLTIYALSADGVPCVLGICILDSPVLEFDIVKYT